MDAADGAVRRAPLRGEELALDVVDGVRLEGDARNAALLRAVVDEAVLADVEIAGARAAPPVVGLAFGESFLEVCNPRIEVLEHLPRPVDRGRHLVVDLALLRAEGLQQALAVVDDADRRREAERPCALIDGSCVLG